MGYRSDVGIALSAHGVKRLAEELAKLEDNKRNTVNAFIRSSDKHIWDDSGAKLYFWSLCKWYEDTPEDYPEVAFFQKLLNDLDCGDYLFLRIGEDMDDAESGGTFYDNPFGMRMVRAIEIAGKLIGRAG